MIREFDIETFNIFSDDENYYFFRALNMGDSNDIETGVVTDNNIFRIRTDRERYNGNPKYNQDSELSLEEMFNHCKMHHRTDTNCISLTSNANVALMYGRGYYKDKYIIVKVPKKDFGSVVVNAGQYMILEIQKVMDEYVSNDKFDKMKKYYLDIITYARTQEQLDKIIEMYNQANEKNATHTEDMFEKGIIYRNVDTTSVDYNALNSKQNLEKNKMVAKLNIIGENILTNVSNKFLIQTLGNVFSSLELIHYKDIEQDEIVEVPTQIVDALALLQQVPGNEEILSELKNKIINFVVRGGKVFNDFTFSDYELSDSEYTIENMFNLTNGSVNFYESINIYKKFFYLSKSRLRSEYVVKLLSEISNNNPKYSEIFNYLLTSTYGVEPEIFLRQSANRMKVSEAVSLNFRPSERSIFDYVNGLSSDNLVYNLNNPMEVLEKYLVNVEHSYQDRETYYINAIIDIFDWSKLGVVSFSDRQRSHLFNKLKECNVVDVYNSLKEQGVKEKDIVNVLLTTVIMERKLVGEIDVNETFTVEQLEDFLGYYKINGTKGLKLRSYQVAALKNVDRIFKTKQFASVVLPTGAGKSFVALAEMLEHSNEEILYLAPNDEILNQIKKYILDIICDEDLTKSDEEKIKERFPNLKLCTYQSLQTDNKNGILNDKEQKIINNKYDLIIFDELHRTGAAEWKVGIDKLLANQDEKTKVLGITATPIRDMDLKDMSVVWARYFGYTEEEILSHKHLAINMDLMEATRLGYVVNSKIVNCEYSLLEKDGLLDNLSKKIDEIMDEDEKNKLLIQYDDLRRRVEQADGIEKILKDSVKQGGKYIVFCPVVNSSGKLLEDEDGYDTDSRLSSEEVIKKYQDELRRHLGAEYELEFYSMLGEYSKSKNRRELEKFEKDAPSKVKLMVVMNKLNEGVHIKDVNGIIWYRPLDENSYILFHQQLGRIIYAIDPNKEYPDEKRPIVIDLVNNTLRVNLEKHNKKETSDLDKIVMISAWIEGHDLKIPDLNSSDRIEARYGSSLKHIQGKYTKYIEDLNLLDNLSERERIEVSTIIQIGNSFDLWSVDFPEKIREEYIRSSESDLATFKLTGILRDYCDLSEMVDEQLSISREEKKSEYIKTLHELKRHPHKKKGQADISEKIFRNGNDQRSYFDNLKSSCKKLKEKVELTAEEKQKIEDYEEIMKVVVQYYGEEYVSEISSEEKKREYIKTLHELGEHPARRARKFRNGNDQRIYFEHLKSACKKLIEKAELTEEEKQKIADYEEIMRVVVQYYGEEYVSEISSEEKKKEYIKTLHELGEHPAPRGNGNTARNFRNGIDQRGYFNFLQRTYKKLKEKNELTEEEKQKIEDYEEIMQVVAQYYGDEFLIEVSSDEKKIEYIKTLHELKGHPAPRGKGNTARNFRDGTDQRTYFNTLQSSCKKIKDKEKLGIEEKQKLLDYEEIMKVLVQYYGDEFLIEVSSEEKKIEYIKTFYELGKHPDKGTKSFRNGNDQRAYFNVLHSAYKKLKTKNELTEEEKQKIADCEEILQAVAQYYGEEYVIEITSEEKKREYIKTLHELGEHPTRRCRSNTARNFRDGKDQRAYFNTLQIACKRLEGKKKLTDIEKQKLLDYEEIMRAYAEVKSGQRFVLSDDAIYTSEVDSLFDDDGSKQAGGEQVTLKK